MTDKTTNNLLRIFGNGSAAAYLMVPLIQLVEVRRLLEDHGIGFWVDEKAISLNGQPAVAFVNFVSGTERQKIQEILDRVA
jgi:hypothetical protein